MPNPPPGHHSTMHAHAHPSCRSAAQQVHPAQHASSGTHHQHYDPEDGRTAQAEALQTHIRNTATCTKCEPLNGQPGRMILDCAGSGDVKRRRFKCNRCKATLSVSQYLAVYSGHADLPGDTAPEAARRMDTLGELPLSSDNPPSGAMSALSSPQSLRIPRRYTSGLANIVINTDHQQQAHQVQQQAAHQDVSQVRLLAEPSSATSPEMGALPAYSGHARTEQGGAADTCRTSQLRNATRISSRRLTDWDWSVSGANGAAQHWRCSCRWAHRARPSSHESRSHAAT